MPKRDVAQRSNIWDIPTIFFMDKSGIIQGKIAGAFSGKIAVEKSE